MLFRSVHPATFSSACLHPSFSASLRVYLQYTVQVISFYITSRLLSFVSFIILFPFFLPHFWNDCLFFSPSMYTHILHNMHMHTHIYTLSHTFLNTHTNTHPHTHLNTHPCVPVLRLGNFVGSILSAKGRSSQTSEPRQTPTSSAQSKSLLAGGDSLPCPALPTHHPWRRAG